MVINYIICDRWKSFDGGIKSCTSIILDATAEIRVNFKCHLGMGSVSRVGIPMQPLLPFPWTLEIKKTILFTSQGCGYSKRHRHRTDRVLVPLLCLSCVKIRLRVHPPVTVHRFCGLRREPDFQYGAPTQRNIDVHFKFKEQEHIDFWDVC